MKRVIIGYIFILYLASSIISSIDKINELVKYLFVD